MAPFVSEEAVDDASGAFRAPRSSFFVGVTIPFTSLRPVGSSTNRRTCSIAQCSTSGVPLLEKKSDRKWGGQADFEAYKRDTLVLIPKG